MNPFEHNIEQNPNPGIDQDDLIAFHLHELSPQQERTLHRVLQTNTKLQFEFEAIAATLGAFPKHEAALPLDAETLERYWLALRPSLVVHFPKPFGSHSLFHRWHLPAFAGVAVTVLALLASLHHQQHTHSSPIATIKAPSSSVHTLLHSAPSSAAPSTNLNLNAFASRLSAINRAWPSPSAPVETDNPIISRSVPPAEPFASATPAQPFSTQTSPAEPPPAANSTIPTAAATRLSSTNSPVPSSTRHHASFPFRHPSATDLTLGIFADLTATSSSTSTSGTGTSLITQSNSQTASPAVGALASFHQQFRPWLGYRVTATYFHPTFEYSNNTSTSSGIDSSGPGLVNTLVYEFAGTYVVQGPHRRRLTTSVEAGASLLDFVPNPNQSQTTSIRAAAIVGVGTEYSLTKRFSLRAEYRAQIYKAPAFSDTDVTGTFASTNTTFSSNPILGITYHFGKTGND